MMKALLLGGTLLVLVACGTTPGERGASGALIGAGTGAAIGGLTGSPGTGAAIGALAGGAIGAVSDPCQLNLGDPFWKDRHASREDYYRRCGHYPN